MEFPLEVAAEEDFGVVVLGAVEDVEARVL
jgi:hypothetical protein